jgi:hypothetical protein
MRNVYINREKYLEEDALFIWITSSLMNYDILKNDIINYFAKNTLPLYCFVIYPKSLILDNSDLLNIENRLDYFKKSKIVFISYDINGQFNVDKTAPKEIYTNYNENEKKINELILTNNVNELINKIQEKTIVKIFKQNNVMMTFDDNYHFKTLSGKHTDKFIKISNLLVNKNEIDFLSICLLKFIGDKNIYVDTSTIISLIQSVILLKKEIDTSYKTPAIYNFHSYDKIKESFRDINTHNTMVIISTTTTGTLIDDIIKINTKVNDILVLFYYPIDGKICSNKFNSLITLSSTMNIPSAPKNYNSENCKFCKNGSIPVQLHSEQFILSIKEPSPVKLTVFHQPNNKQLNEFFKNYSAEDILNIGGKIDNKSFGFIIDNEKLVKNLYFREKLKYILKRHFTYSIKKIIYIDESSKAFAETINNIIEENGNTRLEIYSKENFFEQKDHNSDDSILILAGSIGSGYVLEEISRQLRDTHPDSSRYYILGISKQYSKKSFDFMKGNIDKNHKFNQSHLVLELDKILLPTKTKYTTWDKELEFLKNNFTSDFEGTLDKSIEERIIWLEETKKIATNKDIFWSKHDGKPLELADGFAFWEFYEKNHPNHNKTSQADVLFTFATVLQFARVEKKDLEQTLYDPKIIAPENFARFNDGILQASLLRLAKNSELDYSTNEECSKTITHMIKNIINKYDSPKGEACMEFLIALSTKHLKLYSSDFIDLIDYLKELDIERYPNHYKLILKYLITKI